MSVDLFSGAEEPEPEARAVVYSVSEVTRLVRGLIEKGLGTVWVEGEVSNLRKQPSGHQYFSVKDGGAQLSCVLFGRTFTKGSALADGMQVRLRGRMTVYEARGVYQLNVQQVEMAGAGALQAKFEALKRRLYAEGLFDEERKRALPRFPGRIAVVTSPSGAALRDMLQVFERRAPWLRVMISPVRVQGQGAAEEMIAAIEQLNRAEEWGLPEPEVIVLARGGGSIEDLWEFNSEALARAIAASAIPVVSGVGHEIDFTIADFAADVRAATPSVAAELVAPDSAAWQRRVRQFGEQLGRCMESKIGVMRGRLEYLGRAALFGEPQRRLREAVQSVDFAAEDLERSMRDALARGRRRVEELHAVIRRHRPDQVLELAGQRLAGVRHRLGMALQGRWREVAQGFQQGALRLDAAGRPHLEQARQRLGRVAEMLRLLAPQTVLERGFSISTLEDGTVVRSAGQLKDGTRLVTRLPDGSVSSVVESGKQDARPGKPGRAS